MNKKKMVTMMAMAGFLLFASYGLSMAGSHEFPLMATKSHSGAAGKVALSGEKIDIQAEGLRPNAVYTVWFVNMKPKKQETGAGQPPYMFKTDGQGKGTYSSSLNDSPYGKWAMIMIVQHPDGDPTNMKNMVGALSTKIPKGR